MTEHPLWMLLPWAVFAVAAGVKFWHLTTAFRRHLLDTPTPSQRFRQSLERIWQRDQKAA
ncbi:hypothetical protein [Synechococcus sp. CBW1004]|uniref:hypothetical protein n=1 Tax=Synechococcus sp. CBW1004 TaxID=1353136 RepID=UPI001E41F20F|nr:hypothetical protein [Synechococcus sp. CBW1004]